jgi:hypothetical protein
MSNRTRTFAILLGLIVGIIGACILVVISDLRDASTFMADVEQRTLARYRTKVEQAPLRSPAEDCDGLVRQLEILKKTAPPDLLGGLSSDAIRKLPPTITVFLADHEHGFDSMLDATRCTSTSLDRPEFGRELRPGFAVVKLVLWRAELQNEPRLESAACVQWCNEVLRATLDDRPGGDLSSHWQEEIVPKLESRLAECARSTDVESANLKAADVRRILNVWTPFSTQLAGAFLGDASTLTYYYDDSDPKNWTFRGVRAHLQFRRILANMHALLDRPDAWTVGDTGSYQTRLRALDAELSRRNIRSVPFPDAALVSPGWDIAIGTSNDVKALVDGNLHDYIAVQAYVRMGYASLIAPHGDLKDHESDPLVLDPFAESGAFRWEASKQSFYSVGPNGVDDGGNGDDLMIVKGD